ncbi:MAG TPA: hypothetical protein VMH06_00395 [Thermodesulfovibrionales bacterium]|nr:hypothetical protein [Thermodesulfovibrionales bacterium]
MTKVLVKCGACGFSATVTAAKGPDKKIALSIESDCEMARKLGEDIASLDTAAYFAGFLNNPVYKSAARHLRHVTCPLPGGILKAIEVEAGLNVKRDSSVVFVKEGNEDS